MAVYIHATTLRQASQIAEAQGWKPTQWELFYLHRIRGGSNTVIVTCECIEMWPDWREYISTRQGIIVTVICPRCLAEKYT